MALWAEFGDPIDDSCDLISVSMGTAHAPVAGGPPSKAQAHDCHIAMDQTTLGTVLNRMCVSGETIDSVQICFSRDEDSPPFLTYVMGNVLVSSCVFRSAGRPTIEVGLDFDSLNIVRG